MEDVAPLFAQRGEVGADGAEGLGAGDGTQTPGGLLLEFRHADIAFGLVAVEGHTRVGEKTQDIVGVPVQTQEKIDRGGSLDTARLPLDTSAGRIVPFISTPDQFAALMKSQTARYANIIKTQHQDRVSLSQQQAPDL